MNKTKTPQCDRFKTMLEETNWGRELMRRLAEDAGWNYAPSDHHSVGMRWNIFKEVPHSLAQWILDTLPGVYQATVERFDANPENAKNELAQRHAQPT
jgi:hypothetical protein